MRLTEMYGTDAAIKEKAAAYDAAMQQERDNAVLVQGRQEGAQQAQQQMAVQQRASQVLDYLRRGGNPQEVSPEDMELARQLDVQERDARTQTANGLAAMAAGMQTNAPQAQNTPANPMGEEVVNYLRNGGDPSRLSPQQLEAGRLYDAQQQGLMQAASNNMAQYQGR